MDELIEHMKDCGWEECEDGKIRFESSNPTVDLSDMEFDNWKDAIFACIEVGSGV